VRLQSFTNKPFFSWMIGIRDKARDVSAEVVENFPKAYIQEVAVDSLRHSDWAVTLVLLYLDLHALAERVPNPKASGPFLSSAWGAIFPVLIIVFGSITRFLCNNGRPGKGRDRTDQAGNLLLPKPADGCVQFAAFLSFVAATAFFVLPLVNLVHMVGNPWDLESKPYEDAMIIWLIMFLQTGYPVISVIEWVVLTFVAKDLRDVYGTDESAAKAPRPMPGDQYPPLLSLFKDLGYGSLDTLTKGGLAVYVAFRAAR
jgi:hypothetical protein